MPQKTKALLEGWGIGIWNDLTIISGVPTDTGTPTIGWLKSSSGVNGPCLKGADSTDYEVYFQNGNAGDDMRFVSGKAWLGIGSQSDTNGDCQNDLPSLGWLDFGADPGSLCGGQSDCHGARWHKTGGDNYTGYLDGYAHIESMDENGWVRLRDPNPDPKKYAVTVDNNGVLSGYAWNSGTESALPGNSGLGWIETDGLIIAECDVSSVPKELCQGETFPGPTCDGFCNSGSTCVPDLGGGSSFTNWTCTRGCGSAPGAPNIIIPEVGQCGSLNGKSICDKSDTPPEELCTSGTPSAVDYSALTGEWTCGNTCGEKVTCSASARCGWIETAP